MIVSSEHSFRKKEASLWLFNIWQREWLRVFFQVSTETIRKAKTSAQKHPSLVGAQVTTGYTSPEAWQEDNAETEVRHADDTSERSSTCGACLNGENRVRVWIGALHLHHYKGVDRLPLTDPCLLLLLQRTASTVSRWYSWGWSKDRRERDGRARQAWKQEVSFPC